MDGRADSLSEVERRRIDKETVVYYSLALECESVDSYSSHSSHI